MSGHKHCTPETVEAVARAICQTFGKNPDHWQPTFPSRRAWQRYIPHAQAALAAVPEAEPCGQWEKLTNGYSAARSALRDIATDMPGVRAKLKRDLMRQRAERALAYIDALSLPSPPRDQQVEGKGPGSG